MSATLIRYSRCFAREFVVHRLAVVLILLAFVSGLPTYLMTKNTPSGFMQSTQGVMLARQMFAQSVTLFLPLGAFVGAAGLVSADRQAGYFRFFFSKPVSVLGYYGTMYVVHALIFIAVFGSIVWIYGSYTIHFSVHGGMAAAALTFLLIGGLGLCFGALTRFDGGVLILVYTLALILQQMLAAKNALPDGGLPRWAALAAKALPPVVKLDRVRDSMYALAPVDMSAFWHVVAYGGGAALIGLVCLRRLPLSR